MTRRELIKAAAAGLVLPRFARAATPSRYYYLGPWVWDTSELGGFWRAPTGTIGLLDLRPIGPTGYGFFAADRPLGSDYQSYGDGTSRLEDVILDPSARALWSSQLGIGAIVGTRLIDALWETLTLHGDPDGGIICPPLMPTHLGALELHLGGHSLIRSERFTGRNHYAFPRIQALIQRNYRPIREQAYRDHKGPGAPDLHSKWLECMRRKLSLTADEATGLLIPAGLPKELPKKPTTTLTDDFTRGDQAGLGTAAGGWSWSTLAGSPAIVSNQASIGSAAAARADSDLSSDDHYVEASAVNAAYGEGVLARVSGAAYTCYHWRVRGASSNLFRVSAGAFTSLSTDAKTGSAGVVLRLTADGSSISGDEDGATIRTVTDSAVSGNVRGGLRGADAGATADNFEAADLVAGGSTVPVKMQCYRRLRG